MAQRCVFFVVGKEVYVGGTEVCVGGRELRGLCRCYIVLCWLYRYTWSLCSTDV